MAAPAFTPSATVAYGRRGDCVIEMAVTAGWGGAPPTEGQLWPRGDYTP